MMAVSCSLEGMTQNGCVMGVGAASLGVTPWPASQPSWHPALA